MVLTIENIFLVGSILLLISVVAGKTSYRFGIPTLVLFLGVGMMAGQDGIGGIVFNDPRITQFIGIFALNFILFSGGLDTDWKSVKPIMKQGLVLSTLGVFLTAITVGSFVYWITDFTIYESMLLGSIVSSTDAAAVFSILRSKSISLKSNLRPTLEFESGSNDPMAYVLTIAFLSLVVHQDKSIWSIIPFFIQQMTLGALLGFVFGRLSRFIINRIQLVFEGLYPVLVIALMFITFSATDFVGGNGFLAIYICGIYLGNHDMIHKKTILQMFDGSAWMMQIVLFLTLGLLVNPKDIIPVIGIGIAISLFLMMIARPFSVLLSLIPFRMEFKRRMYISWVGLRGAVPIVFATYPLLAGIDKANMIFNIVFFISVSSVLFQGTTLSMVARWLDQIVPEKEKPVSDTDRLLENFPKSFLKEYIISENCPVNGKRIVDIDMPSATFISLIFREGKYIRPGGSTVLQNGDKLTVIAETEEDLSDFAICIHRKA